MSRFDEKKHLLGYRASLTSPPPTIRPAAGAWPHPQSQLERAVAGRDRPRPGMMEPGRTRSRLNSWLLPVRAVLFLSRPTRSEKEKEKLRLSGVIMSRGKSWLLLARSASTCSVSSSGGGRLIVKLWTREAAARVRRSNQGMAGRNRGLAWPESVYMRGERTGGEEHLSSLSVRLTPPVQWTMDDRPTPSSSPHNNYSNK